MVAHALTVFTEYAKRMSLIYIDIGVVFVSKSYDFFQISNVAFHRKDSIDYYHLDFVGVATLQTFFERLHVVVLEFHGV